MRILVIAATRLEIAPFIIDNKGIEILITGVGVPSTMYQLQKKLQLKTTDFVIQAGIAGTFSPEISLGRVMLVKQDTFADIGIEEKGKFTNLFEAGFADKNTFPFTDGWLINSNNIITKSLLPAVRAVTVNRVSDSQLQKQQIIDGFSPSIETMEGAALHYVCLQESIPFLQIRSLSNFVGERDKGKWKMKEAITNLNNELTGLADAVLALQAV